LVVVLCPRSRNLGVHQANDGEVSSRRERRIQFQSCCINMGRNIGEVEDTDRSEWINHQRRGGHTRERIWNTK
ncbi:hypothetical protein LTR16_010957, partial [Cryomyces antarcticus]